MSDDIKDSVDRPDNWPGSDDGSGFSVGAGLAGQPTKAQAAEELDLGPIEDNPHMLSEANEVDATARGVDRSSEESQSKARQDGEEIAAETGETDGECGAEKQAATEGVKPKPYYRTMNQNDPFSQLARHNTIGEYKLWTAIAATFSDDLDASAEYARIGTRVGASQRIVEANIFALLTLESLPLVKAMQDEIILLDMARLRAIDKALSIAESSYLPEIDAQLLAYLTPTRTNQILPGPRAIRVKIRSIITALDASVDADADAPSPDQENLSINFRGDNADLYARLSAADAAILTKRIKATAEQHNITQDEAFKEILAGTGVNITLNLYKASDIANSPGWIPNVGWLSRTQTHKLMEKVKRTRHIDPAGTRISPSYVTPSDIEAYLDGRDGNCRFPDCSVDPEKCDNDHRINHADGGPTSATNMVKLCRHHHNMKTAQRLHYIIDPHTDDVYWLFEDGTWLVDHAEGPLSKAGRQWLQSISQRYEARNNRAREKAQDWARQYPKPPPESSKQGSGCSWEEKPSNGPKTREQHEADAHAEKKRQEFIASLEPGQTPWDVRPWPGD